MPLDALLNALPPYAADIGASLRLILDDGALGDDRRWGCLLACAHALGEPRTVRAVEDDAGVTPEVRHAARAAAAIGAMNDVYFRAVSSMSNPAFGTMASRLDMRALADPPVARDDFELMSVSVAALHGCGPCLDAHETELRKRGVPAEAVQLALRIAAVMNAAAAVLRAESALGGKADHTGAGGESSPPPPSDDTPG